MRLAGNVACMEGKHECGIVVGKPEGERRLERLDAGGKIILELVLKK